MTRLNRMGQAQYTEPRILPRWTEDFMYLGVKYYTNKFNFDVPSLLEEIKRETV